MTAQHALVRPSQEHCGHEVVVPVLIRTDQGLGWEQKASKPPKYWFRCTVCRSMFCVNWEKAAECGWVDVVNLS